MVQTRRLIGVSGREKRTNGESSDRCSSPPKNCEGVGLGEVLHLAAGTQHEKKKTPKTAAGWPARGRDLHMPHFPLQINKPTAAKQPKTERPLPPEEASTLLQKPVLCIVWPPSSFWHFLSAVQPVNRARAVRKDGNLFTC